MRERYGDRGRRHHIRGGREWLEKREGFKVIETINFDFVAKTQLLYIQF